MFSPTPKLWNEPHIRPLFFSKNQAEAGQKGEEADALRCTAKRYKKKRLLRLTSEQPQRI